MGLEIAPSFGIMRTQGVELRSIYQQFVVNSRFTEFALLCFAED